MSLGGIGSQPMAYIPIAAQGENLNAGGIQNDIDELIICVQDLKNLVLQLSGGQDGFGWLD